ncbi:hypothetical protein BS329_41640 [Amycolatopsis coloradensis]|uniref:Uncharacterized protein n=1 Tax=Amycolatopsis coloradensis TaxID=76021 RepID=A0A1R0KCX1_9PSEU|nr:hypothetical protein [Amycolatopsis coloradensis]OLZ42774.1 hypothetical protein BS329_41640 [Amycolatopsis coloradensis]
MIDNGWTPHGLRYYVIVFSALLVALVMAIFVFDRATWVLPLLGVLTGGFLVDAVVDRYKHRRNKDNESDES